MGTVSYSQQIIYFSESLIKIIINLHDSITHIRGIAIFSHFIVINHLKKLFTNLFLGNQSSYKLLQIRLVANTIRLFNDSLP